MDHLCYLDSKEKEYEKLLIGEKTRLARATSSKKPPYKHVFSGDRIFFVNENLEIILSGEVKDVINAEKTDGIGYKDLILIHKEDLSISKQKIKILMRKKYLVLISLFDVKQVKIGKYHNIKLIKKKKWLLAGNLRYDNKLIFK